MKCYQAFTEKFYGGNVEGPSKCQSMNVSLTVWFVQFGLYI